MRANIHSGRGTTLVFVAWIIITLAAWACRGADISAGYSFTPTDRVTSTKLNALVGSATITPTFLSGKGSAVPDVSDAFLFLPNGSTTYRQTTFANMVRDYTGLITAQTEDTTPATGDWLLTYDISASGYKKSQLNSVIFTNNALINARTNWPTPNRTTTSLLAYDSVTGEHSKLSRSNLFYQFFEFNTWTNQPTHTAPAITDTIPVFDSTAGTNKQVTFTMLMTNNPVVTTNGPSDYFVTETNGVLKKVAYSTLLTVISNQVRVTSFTTNFALASVTTGGAYINGAHGLVDTPTSVKVSLLCTSTEMNYAVNDEVLNPMMLTTSWKPSGSVWCNSTNFGWSQADAASNIRIFNKTTGAEASITPSKWSLKIRLEYKP